MNLALSSLLVLTAGDDVAVARGDIVKGQELFADGLRVTALTDIPSGHKIALRAVSLGQPVRKYGQVIGQATGALHPGDYVHVHNLEMPASSASLSLANVYQPTVYQADEARFEGYVRADGRVGTRNYIAVIASVNCSATACKQIAAAFDSGRLRDYPNVDGVVAITHGSGCGMGAKGDGIEILKRTLRGYADHANFAGVLVIGLGCEVNQLAPLMEQLGDRPAVLKASLVIQEAGGTRETVQRGISLVEAMLAPVNSQQRSSAAAYRPSICASVCNAVARTVIRALPLTRRWGRLSIGWYAMAGPRFFRKRRKFMVPNTC